MTDVRSRRLAALADLLRRGRHTRQDELVAALREAGHQVTQATVSRDLLTLGAVKQRGDGATRYALPSGAAARPDAGDRLVRLFAEWVEAAVPAGTLVVLRTPPGSAHLIAAAIDAAGLPQVVGTISGDDTVFVACPSEGTARGIAAQWAEWLSP